MGIVTTITTERRIVRGVGSRRVVRRSRISEAIVIFQRISRAGRGGVARVGRGKEVVKEKTILWLVANECIE